MAWSRVIECVWLILVIAGIVRSLPMAHNILSRMQTAGSDLIPRREVEAMTSLSPSAIYRLMQRGLFPRPIRISPMRVAWLRGEVRGWVEQRMAEQRAE